VDTELFAPLSGETPEERLRGVAENLGPGEAWGRDPAKAASALIDFSQADGPRVVFIGKLIVSKGIDLLLAAWPLVVSENPGARLLVVGFGEYRETTERLWAAISAADIDDVEEIATKGRALEGGDQVPLRMLASFIDHLPEGYAEAARAAAGTVAFAGRLEHDEVARIVPACDALVFPSTFPESFGMVAAEAAAAEVPPVSANHSGAAEVTRALAADLPEEAAALVAFDLGDGAVEAIVTCLNGWLGMDAEHSEKARAELRKTATRLWSWEGVARSVIDACSG
jgi:glycosyltransferase involved in cell wall biosynthesis